MRSFLALLTKTRNELGAEFCTGVMFVQNFTKTGKLALTAQCVRGARVMLPGLKLKSVVLAARK